MTIFKNYEFRVDRRRTLTVNLKQLELTVVFLFHRVEDRGARFIFIFNERESYSATTV